MSQSIQKFFSEMQEEYSDELFDTHEDLKKFFASKISENPKFKSKKINLYYAYLILYSSLRGDFNFFIYKLSQTKKIKLKLD